VLVTDAYTRRCSITGERTLPALEAAHIVPYAIEQSNAVSNGLLLRADLHNLFDQGLITVTPDYRVKVSPAIRERFENGRDYYALEGAELKIIPSAKRERPDQDRLAWHGANIFAAG
jgi:putative restriction endonuclease